MSTEEANSSGTAAAASTTEHPATAPAANLTLSVSKKESKKSPKGTTTSKRSAPAADQPTTENDDAAPNNKSDKKSHKKHSNGDEKKKEREEKPLLDPVDNSNNTNKKKLTPEEMSAMANRLSHSNRETVILPPIFVSKRISNEQLSQNVEKLYTQSIAHRKQVLEKLEETHKARDSGEAAKGDNLLNLHQTLPSTELDNTFERLYTVYMDNKRRKEMKREDDERKAKESQRKLNKAELKSCAARLCDESLEKTKQMNQKLLEKYCPEKEYRHMTKEELQASAARLTRKE